MCSRTCSTRCRSSSGAPLARAALNRLLSARGADEVPARRVAAPSALVQRRRRHAEPAAARAAPGHRRAGRAGRPRAALPDGADHAGGQRGRRRSRSRRRSSTSTASGARRRSIARAGSSRPLGTKSRIFYKYEGVSPPGSHKPNTAVAQAYYNKQEGRTRLSTETGAGQWGSALAFACKLIGLECKVYMVRDLVRAEAVPALDDSARGAPRSSPSPSRRHAERAARSSTSIPDYAGQPRDRDLGGGRGRGAARRHVVLARQRAQPRAPAPDGHRPGGDRSRWSSPARSRTSSSAASAAARTSPGSRSRSCARRSPAARSTCSPASRRRARR